MHYLKLIGFISMAIAAGELRHKIIFLKKVMVDGLYGKEEQWQAFKTVRAKVTPQKTDESESEHGKTRKVKLIIDLRFLSTVSEDNRLMFNNVEFEITSCIDLLGTRRELIIDALKRS